MTPSTWFLVLLVLGHWTAYSHTPFKTEAECERVGVKLTQTTVPYQLYSCLASGWGIDI